MARQALGSHDAGRVGAGRAAPSAPARGQPSPRTASRQTRDAAARSQLARHVARSVASRSGARSQEARQRAGSSRRADRHGRASAGGPAGRFDGRGPCAAAAGRPEGRGAVRAVAPWCAGADGGACRTQRAMHVTRSARARWTKQAREQAATGSCGAAPAAGAGPVTRGVGRSGGAVRFEPAPAREGATFSRQAREARTRSQLARQVARSSSVASAAHFASHGPVAPAGTAPVAQAVGSASRTAATARRLARRPPARADAPSRRVGCSRPHDGGADDRGRTAQPPGSDPRPVRGQLRAAGGPCEAPGDRPVFPPGVPGRGWVAVLLRSGRPLRRAGPRSP